jgi:hypothetical protein
MGRYPVIVVNLHITYARTMKVDYSRFSLGEGYMGSMSMKLRELFISFEDNSVSPLTSL